MGTNILMNGPKYEGKYVALKSFSDRTVVASGSRPDKVMAVAIKGGTKEPVIVYVPKKNTTYIY